MFFCLWHYTIVSCNHQQGEINGSYPGQHVIDEPDVAGHIDKAKTATGFCIRVGEAQVNRQATLLLFLQPVGVNARKCLHQ